MEIEDIKLLSELIAKIVAILILIFGPKLGRLILHKYPDNIALKIVFSEDVGKGHYFIWMISSVILSIILFAITHINFYLIFFISLFLMLIVMVMYYRNKGIYSLDKITDNLLIDKNILKKSTDSGNRLKDNCTIHNDRRAMSICSVCKKPFCYNCLWEGNGYYYCNNEECQKMFKNNNFLKSPDK